MSGSMEPEIPVGSMILVETVQPEEVQAGEVIVFRAEGSVVAHRVVENQFVVGEFITKGDANAAEDINSVPYSRLLGRVIYHVPYLGQFMALYTSPIGKLYVFLFVLCGVLFNILAERLRVRERERREEAEAARLRKE